MRKLSQKQAPLTVVWTGGRGREQKQEGPSWKLLLCCPDCILYRAEREEKEDVPSSLALASLYLLKVNWFYILLSRDPPRETASTSCIPVHVCPPPPTLLPCLHAASWPGRDRGTEGPRLNLRLAPLPRLCQEGEVPEASLQVRVGGMGWGAREATLAFVAFGGLSLGETMCDIWLVPKLPCKYMLLHSPVCPPTESGPR